MLTRREFEYFDPTAFLTPGSWKGPDGFGRPHSSLPTAIAGKVFASTKRPPMRRKTFRDNE